MNDRPTRGTAVARTRPDALARQGRTMQRAPDHARAWSPARPLFLGFAALALLVVGVGGWSAMASITGAVVSSGMIEVEGNRQAVQHPEGGVVGEILVDDGDPVEAGDVVLRFDDQMQRSEFAIIAGQLDEILARKARLTAERDGADTVEFPDELSQRAALSDEVAELIEGQRRLFAARRETMHKQAGQLRERVVQTERQIEGTRAQIAALSEQRSLIQEELQDQQTLLERGLTQQGNVLALRRESARLGGVLGELQAQEAQAQAQISQVEIEILRLGSGLREEAITTLRDLGYREIELRERRLAMIETLARLEVRAPVSGLVHNRRINTVGAVVRPADVLMHVVPQGQPLVITARIDPIDIDEVHVGQPATLRFPAFAQRSTPEITGAVTRLSPDAFTDENTGRSFFTAELIPLEGEMEKLGGLELLPGMPVEAYIRTGERTPLNYLVKPLADYFNRAFRES